MLIQIYYACAKFILKKGEVQFDLSEKSVFNIMMQMWKIRNVPPVRNCTARIQK